MVVETSIMRCIFPHKALHFHIGAKRLVLQVLQLLQRFLTVGFSAGGCGPVSISHGFKAIHNQRTVRTHQIKVSRSILMAAVWASSFFL